MDQDELGVRPFDILRKKPGSDRHAGLQEAFD